MNQFFFVALHRFLYRGPSPRFVGRPLIEIFFYFFSIMFRFPPFALFDNISPFYWLRSVKLFASQFVLCSTFPASHFWQNYVNADGNVTCASVAHCLFGIVFFRVLAVLSGSVFHLVVSCRFSCRWFFVSVCHGSIVESIKAVSLCSTYRWKTIGMCSRGSLTRLQRCLCGKYGKRVYGSAYVIWEECER